jgi:hypothetical protein
VDGMVPHSQSMAKCCGWGDVHPMACGIMCQSGRTHSKAMGVLAMLWSCEEGWWWWWWWLP